MEAYRVLLRGVRAQALCARVQDPTHFFAGGIRAASSAPMRCGPDLIRLLNRRSTAVALVSQIVRDQGSFAGLSDTLDSGKRVPPNCWPTTRGRRSFAGRCDTTGGTAQRLRGSASGARNCRPMNRTSSCSAARTPVFSDRGSESCRRIGGRVRLKVYDNFTVTRGSPRPPMSCAKCAARSSRGKH